MTKGKEIAEFKLQCSTATCSAGEAGSKLLAFNFWGEGTGVQGMGRLMGTVTFDTGQQGKMEYCGVVFLESGELFNSSATGTYRSVGKHQWSTRMLLHSSDSSVTLSEGLIDLVTGSWSGRLFEWLPEGHGRISYALEHRRLQTNTAARGY
jgi:hypothetical protein